MKDYICKCDLCNEIIDGAYYLIQKYTPNKIGWIKVFYPAQGNTKELDICKDCMNKLIGRV